jgi:hypothetical protein
MLSKMIRFFLRAQLPFYCLAGFNCLLFLAFAPTAQGQESLAQLANEKMETVVEGKPIGWNFVSNCGGTLAVETDNTYEGISAAKIDVTAGKEVPQLFTNLMQSVDATSWRGKKIRFRAAVRTSELAEGARAQLWVRVDREKGANGVAQIGAFDNMDNRPIREGEWKEYSIVLEVAKDATSISLGMFVIGRGVAWLDAVSLEVAGDSEKATDMKIASSAGTPRLTPALQKAMLEADQSPRQPFWSIWLLLPMVALLLFMIAMWGNRDELKWDEKVAVEESDGVKNIGRLRKFSIRFTAAYWFLYCWPQPWAYLLPILWGWQSWVTEKMVKFTAVNLFRIERELVQPNGSGDTTFNYLIVFNCFVLAWAIASAWSLVDWRRTRYPVVQEAVWILLRYVLAITMLGYGLAKLSMDMNQFPAPGVMQLEKTWGNSSPMNVLWTFMGASRAYTMFGGLGEVVGGLLLIWRRTAVLGAIVSGGVMLNVVMLNFCYDVPVKLLSTHLLVMAILIVLPDAPRLLGLLVLNRPAPAANLETLWTNRVVWWLKAAAKSFLIIVCFGVPLYGYTNGLLAYFQKPAAERAIRVEAEKYLLTRRGFRWINEVPFNR